jgi:hypothetical protein
MEWFTDHQNICRLVRHLHERDVLTPEEIIAIIEKPWKWEAEWTALNAPECATCGDTGEVAGDPFASDGLMSCPDCGHDDVDWDWADGR